MNIDKELFRQRRRGLADRIEDNSAVVIPAAPIAVRSNDVEYVYRQDNDFYYLTGFGEPDSLAVIAPGNPDGEFLLFVRPRDRERETWTGRRSGVEGATAVYGADRAYPIAQLDEIVPQILSRVDTVYYPLAGNEPMNQRMIGWMRRCQEARPRSGGGASALVDPRPIIHEMRLFKEPAELDAMRHAIAISNEAHRAAMRQARGGMGEWAVEALIDYTFRVNGASGPAYPSIVASGPNATVLHYIHNDREMNHGEMLLIDAGSEYGLYASDITRTFPVKSRLSPVQRDLYQLVLDAQLAGIETARPGATIEEVHEASLRVLVEGMRQLRLLAGTTEELLKSGDYRRYYMHRTSHWLGLDVHDVGNYRAEGKPRTLEPGMVLTVEPGLYVPADDDQAPAEMRGIGIRIEDDVLVTPSGNEVLSAAIPKRIAEVEELTAS